ncbi:hypothetical protein AQUCO_02700357v1, partial [Aquilegia coerulea]
MATVHSLEYLRSKNITKIGGEVQCRRCNARYIHEFDLEEKFNEIAEYIHEHKERMDGRASKPWLVPDCPTCNYCGTPDCMRPVLPLADQIEEINWLFLLLGQILGFCTLCQLKCFCQHSGNNSTGPKERLLYVTYLALFKQLDPM